MDPVLARTNPETWIDLVFSAKAVAKGGVVRRSRAWVAREIGVERFIEEVQRRGFHMVECGGQFIVIYNQQGLRVIC